MLMSERDFSELDCILDVDEEVDKVVQMYREVRQTAQDNAPGNVLAPRGNIASLIKKSDSKKDDVALSRAERHIGSHGIMGGLQGIKNQYAEHRGEVETQVEEKAKDVKDAEGRVKQGAIEEVGEYKRKAEEDIQILEKGLKNM